MTALGIDKVARIYYEAGTRLNDIGHRLQRPVRHPSQACLNLVGTNSITTADCASVQKAVTATR